MSIELLSPSKLLDCAKIVVGHDEIAGAQDRQIVAVWDWLRRVQLSDYVWQMDAVTADPKILARTLRISGIPADLGVLEPVHPQHLDKFHLSMRLIEDFSLELRSGINIVSPKFGLIRSEKLSIESGSTFSAIGLSIVNTKYIYAETRFIESIIHESIHNALNLYDIMCGVFMESDIVHSNKFMFFSPFKNQYRTFDLSFHALAVALAIEFAVMNIFEGRQTFDRDVLQKSITSMLEVFSKAPPTEDGPLSKFGLEIMQLLLTSAKNLGIII